MSTINEYQTMIADVTVYNVKTPCKLRIGATSGTVTFQLNINGTFFNTDTTIANGTFKFIEFLQQGDQIKVTGGNAIIQAFETE